VADVTAHQHVWHFTAHVDGCHFFLSTAGCECGATLTQWAERDVAEDPYSAVWFIDGCTRCDELAAGARVEPFRNDIDEPSRA
jgi:hypothetical protein